MKDVDSIVPSDLDLWPWKFQILLRTKYVPCLVKIHWRMLILECLQGSYAVKIWPGDLDLWPWISIGFQTLLRTKYVPSLVKIHWRKLILECSQRCFVVKIWPGDIDLWPMTLKINRVPDSPKFSQNPLTNVDSRVFTRMLHGKNLTRWPWKSIGFQTLLRTKYVPSLFKIHWRMLILEWSQGCYGRTDGW